MPVTKAVGPYCSFCRKSRKQVGMLVAGGGSVHICGACVALCSRVLTGKPAAAFAGWASLSDEEFLATLPADQRQKILDTAQSTYDMWQKNKQKQSGTGGPPQPVSGDSPPF